LNFNFPVWIKQINFSFITTLYFKNIGLTIGLN